MIAAVLFAAALEASTPAANDHSPPVAKLCLDPLGINRGATCQRFDGSLLSTAPDICSCLSGGTPVVAPVCRRGETPQAETAAFDLARWRASVKDGTLVGKTYQGRSFCVPGP